MRKSYAKAVVATVVLSLMAANSLYAAAYYTGFEDATKASYAIGDVTLSNVVWTLDSATIGTLAGDKKIGVKSARLAYNGGTDYTASVYFAETVTGSYSALSYKYAVYGTSSTYPVDLRLAADISTDDGGSWNELALRTITTADQSLADVSTTFGPYNYVRLRFRLWGLNCTYTRQRANVDNVALIPEPSTALIVVGLIGAGLMAFLRRK